MQKNIKLIKKIEVKPKEKETEQKFTAYEHLDKIGEIPVYYGFVPHKSPDIKKTDLEHAKSLLEGDFIDGPEDSKNHLPLHVEEKVALLRMYTENNLHTLPQPVMFYFKEPFRGSIKKGNVYKRYCDLQITG